MAEGGEGEEEIQFLRTVSPAYLLLLGRADLHGVMKSGVKFMERGKKKTPTELDETLI